MQKAGFYGAMPACPILFIDDNLELVAAYQVALGEHGFCVTGAANGIEALNLRTLDSNKWVAIVDLKMPEMDGTETIAALLARDPTLKILVVSGQSLQPYFSRLSDLGVRFFLPKPFSIDALLDNIRQLQGA